VSEKMMDKSLQKKKQETNDINQAWQEHHSE